MLTLDRPKEKKQTELQEEASGMGEWAKEEEQLQLPPRVFGHSLRAAAFNKII